MEHIRNYSLRVAYMDCQTCDDAFSNSSTYPLITRLRLLCRYGLLLLMSAGNAMWLIAEEQPWSCMQVI